MYPDGKKMSMNGNANSIMQNHSKKRIILSENNNKLNLLPNKTVTATSIDQSKASNSKPERLFLKSLDKCIYNNYNYIVHILYTFDIYIF